MVAGFVEDIGDTEISPAVTKLITSGILYASDMARDLGNPTWTYVTAPKSVQRIVAAAVARWVNNTEGLITSRAGDETLAWAESVATGMIEFSDMERQRLAKHSLRATGFGSFGVESQTILGEDGERTLYVPVQGSSEPFPFWAVR